MVMVIFNMIIGVIWFRLTAAAEGLVGVSRKATKKSLIKELEVGYKKVKVNMLQFADNTLFFCDASIKSMYNLKVLLNYFEIAFGLKVNFSKSRIGGVGIDQNVILRFASILNCEMTKTPFKYMGMPKEKRVLGRCS
ncbi:uncharacterized protein [Phaseolus vulgaris]|uniref:uncharacterized protein n=1 Tax=Phaseolus vulgaris TaxID=3885 RepID=UPI0035CB8070